jgi:hypothetical protein
MGQPGNPTEPGPPAEGSEPDPEQAGWASPTPPPPPPPPPAPGAPPTYSQPPSAPTPTYQQPPSEPPAQPPAQPPAATPAWGAQQPAWGSEPPVWGTPPPGGVAPPTAPGAGWVPPGPGAGPPPKKRRLTWLWFLIPTLVVFVAAFVVIIVFAVKLVGGPIEATNDYYADVKAARYASAYDHLCSSQRVNYTRRQFADLLSRDAQSKGRVEEYDFHDSELNSDDDGDTVFSDATVKGTVRRSGTDYETRVRLRKEDGDWKVCAVLER